MFAMAQVDLQKQVWKQAATHEHGGGLESGIPSLLAARKAVKHMRKQGLHVQARALEYIVVGCFHDPDDTTPEHLAVCARCAKGVKATRYHITYECPDNLKILDPIFLKTGKLQKDSRHQHIIHPRLRLRGLIPNSLLKKLGLASIFEARLWITEHFDNFCI